MKKLLLASSLLCILLISLESCKVKKKKTLKEAQVQGEMREPAMTAQDSIVRAPGVENQAELDSIKAALRKLKKK